MDLLQVAKSNQKFRKLDASRRVLSISMRAGHTCPFARDCLARVDIVNGKRELVFGDNTEFVCFSAAQEHQYTGTYEARERNELLLKQAKKNGVGSVSELIERSLLNKMTRKQRRGAEPVLIRIHISGDFFALWYLDAWICVANRHPEWTLYAYTKALPLVRKRLEIIPSNLRLIASRGGTHDHLINVLGLREARVVFSKKEAETLGLPVDIDDSLAAYGDGDFALYIHGRQKKGTLAARAVAEFRKQKRGVA